MGITPLMGGTQRMAERAGTARAREFVMTGGLYTAETLHGWGVVNRVLPAGRAARQGARASRPGWRPARPRPTSPPSGSCAPQADHGTRGADERTAELTSHLFETEDTRNAVRSFLEHGPGQGERSTAAESSSVPVTLTYCQTYFTKGLLNADFLEEKRKEISAASQGAAPAGRRVPPPRGRRAARCPASDNGRRTARRLHRRAGAAPAARRGDGARARAVAAAPRQRDPRHPGARAGAERAPASPSPSSPRRWRSSRTTSTVSCPGSPRRARSRSPGAGGTKRPCVIL